MGRVRDLNVWKLEEIQAVGLVYQIVKVVSMKSKIISISLSMVVLSGLAGCQGIKASVDNAQVKAVPRFNEKGERSYDENGMPEFVPEVSVPVWRSRGLKETHRDLTPEEVEGSK